MLGFSATFSFADRYPKNPKVDILNYLFNIELSDTSDEINLNMIVDVRFLGAAVDSLRLDLTKTSAALQNKGMKVHQVKTGDETLQFTHDNDALKIKLPTKSIANQRSQITVSYSGVPATGLKIANNKYGDCTSFCDNCPDKARTWLIG